MALADKLRILADSAKYDASCASSGAKRSAIAGGLGHSDGNGICHSYTPDGRCVSLLKILLTNFCIYDCLFCVNRISNDLPRARFTVQEVVELTLDFYRRNYIEGLFLSSGVIQTPDYTMEQLVEVARTLRVDHRFNGYIHLKTMPGASEELLAEAGKWADRLSVNIELPTEREMETLAPEKRHVIIEESMSRIHDRATAAAEPTLSGRRERFAPAGQSTQMVVGASGSTDAEILHTSSRLYSSHGLRRVYYSAFSPIPGAHRVLPSRPPELVREHRLYQADWLMRFYGFDRQELTTEELPNLSLKIDPKLAWALRHPEFFPVDVQHAPREHLLRVPGFGRTTVNRILRARRHHRLSLDDLSKLRARVSLASAFITIGGLRAPRPLRTARTEDSPSVQLSLLDLAS